MVTLYNVSVLWCANIVGKIWGRFDCFEYSLTPFLCLCSCFWPFFCCLERLLFSKMLVNLTKNRGTVGIFNNQHFALELKFESLFLLSYSHNNVFSYGVSFFRSSIPLFLFLAVVLILKICKRANNSRVSSYLAAIIETWLAA